MRIGTRILDQVSGTSPKPRNRFGNSSPLFGVYSAMGLRTCALFTLFSSMLIGQRPSVIDAVHKGHAVGHERDGIAAVSEALASVGDVNERDKTGWTPLMHACLECRAKS